MSQFGDLIETARVKVFFGNKLATLENLKKQFPDLEFRKVKQTHSDLFVEARATDEQDLVEADAHYSRDRKAALLISTADCLPVMAYVPSSNFVVAIHAGWKGIESNIIGKSLKQLRSLGHDVSDTQVWIGPHIGFGSFEVSLDVAERALARLRICKCCITLHRRL